MGEGDHMVFLGTGGARQVVARQLRRSAGIYLCIAGHSMLVDPGPGALVACADADPPIRLSELDAALLTHRHIDHSGDLNAVIDAMTVGGWRRRGEVFVPGDCLEGDHAVVLQYLRDFPDRIVRLEPESSYRTGPVSFATSVRHAHGAETYGLRFRLTEMDLSLVADTAWFDELPAAYAGADVLVVSVVLTEPARRPEIQHLSVPEAERLIGAVEPGMAVLTHFGRHMLEAGPERLAQEMSERLSRPVLAADDGLRLDLPPRHDRSGR